MAPILPPDWQRSRSSAIEAYRFHQQDEVLEILYRKGRKVYPFPCTQAMHEAFVAASSKGRYVERVLKRYAQERGWSRKSYRL
jgi:hypothetical protein